LKFESINNTVTQEAILSPESRKGMIGRNRIKVGKISPPAFVKQKKGGVSRFKRDGVVYSVKNQSE
jgi:hypothetical protein